MTHNKLLNNTTDLNSFFSKRGLVMPIVMVFMLVSQLVYWGLIHLNQTNSQRLINFSGYYQAHIQQLISESLLSPSSDTYLEPIEEHILSSMHASFDLMNPMLTIDQWWTKTPQVGIGTLHSSELKQRVYVYEHLLYLEDTQLDYCDLFPVLFCEGKLNANNTFDPLQFDTSTHYFEDQMITSDTFTELIQTLSDEGFSLVKLSDRNAQHVWQDQTMQNVAYHFNNGTVSLQIQKTFYYLKSHLNHPAIELSSQHPYQSLRYLIKLKGYIYERNIDSEVESASH